MKNWIAAAAMFLSAAPGHSAEQVSAAELMFLQAQMQTYIDANMIDGALLNLNEQTGKVRQLYPAKAHPMIMALGPYYVLCADFRDDKGKDVNVNFFMAREAERVIVFHTTYGHDENLERLVRKGAAKALN